MTWNVPSHSGNRYKPKRRPRTNRGHKPGARGSGQKSYNGYADGVLRTNAEWQEIWRMFERKRAGELGQLTL